MKQTTLDLSVTMGKHRGQQAQLIIEQREKAQRDYIYKAYLSDSYLETLLIDKLGVIDKNLSKRVQSLTGPTLGEAYFFVKKYLEKEPK